MFSVRFSYPHFGDKSELRSGSVRLPCRQAVTVPRGIFEFNFAASADWLRATLRRFPVHVRVDAEDGQPLGAAHVPLHPVLQQKRVYTTVGDAEAAADLGLVGWCTWKTKARWFVASNSVGGFR